MRAHCQFHSAPSLGPDIVGSSRIMLVGISHMVETSEPCRYGLISVSKHAILAPGHSDLITLTFAIVAIDKKLKIGIVPIALVHVYKI